MSGAPGNPYFITGPALISFSGGRTSAFMLWNILQAHCGALPPDVVVAFANTGKEREETLRFVHECETRWGVRIRWLEYRDLSQAYLRKDSGVEQSFEEVGFNSASRRGSRLRH
jgi:3'-phosphoadenosine 5'-phosphosulfate sulfotransferase (PAPS reductase)/FAD synthetase